MKRIIDPFPPTPAGFHRRVEDTLMALEDRRVKPCRTLKIGCILAAAALIALLAATAVATVAGHAGFKDSLNAIGSEEVAGMVEEPHFAADKTDGIDFEFSIDEIIWEDGDLYIGYSLSTPKDGNYMVAMFTPTINGDKLQYDAKGWTSPKFFDSDEEMSSVILLGGNHGATCNELWTFSVDPQLRHSRENRIAFRAVLLRSDCDLVGAADWTDMLNPPESLCFRTDWREWMRVDMEQRQRALMAEAADAFVGDGRLSLGELIATGHAEYVTERALTLNLDSTQLEQTVYNDVAERDFDVDGVHLHVDDFRMTHLGISIKYTLSVPGQTEPDAAKQVSLNRFLGCEWGFGTTGGSTLGYSLGGSGGASRALTYDGSQVWHCGWSDSLILSLKDLDQIIFAPLVYEDDENGNQLPPVYDMERAITLKPIHGQAVTPPPDDENEPFC